MRVLFTSQPAYGHVAPLMPLARAMTTLGHDVRLATAASFLPALSGSGVTPVAAGIDWLESRPELVFPDVMEHRGEEGKRFLLREVFCRRTAPALASDVLRGTSDWRPELLIREPWEFGGAIAAEVLETPCLVHGIGALANTLEVLDVGSRALREIGVQFGLGANCWLPGRGYLDPCPASLSGGDVPTDFFRAAHAIRPEPFQFEQPDRVAARDWPGPPSERPRVYVGMGTVMHRKPGVWPALLSGLAQVDADFVLSTGPGNALGQERVLPGNVVAREFVDLRRLLPTCDAVVCHAGWSTTMAALWHGLPLVLVPLGADGPTTVQRIVAAGAAVEVPVREVAAQVARAVDQALRDSELRRASARLQAEIRSLPAPSSVATELLRSGTG